MAVLRSESEMKESGIEWIGNIPSGWHIVPVLSLLSGLDAMRDGPFGSDLKNEEYTDTGVPVVQLGAIQDGKFEDKKLHYITEKKANSLLRHNAFPHDIVIAKMMPAGKAAILPEKFDRYVVSADVIKATIAKETWSKWLIYALNCYGITQCETQSQGATRSRININKAKRIKIAMPDDGDVTKCLDYLDDRCSKLDEIITEAEKSIEEYKELEQAVIFEAVTKGLDKNVPMKDSGMEFVDKIPETWQVVRFIRTNWVRGRLGWKGLKADEYVDEGYPFLSAFNIINSHLSWDDLNHITQERYDESPEIKLSIGDIVLVKDGAGIGKCARIDELPLGAATVNSSLAVITPQENIYYKYEYYYFLSPLFQNIIARLRNGMGVPHLTQESMKAIYIPLPSIEEQKEISVYLDARVNELDALISEKQSLIEDLKAYKKSLIYEVVTGKRRVV